MILIGGVTMFLVFQVDLLKVKSQINWMSLYSHKRWMPSKMFYPQKYDFYSLNHVLLPPKEIMGLISYLCWNCSDYEEAREREEEKLRNQRQDFSDVVAELCYIWFHIIQTYPYCYYL